MRSHKKGNKVLLTRATNAGGASWNRTSDLSIISAAL